MKPIWLKKGFFINLCILLVIFGLGFGLHWLSQQTVVASWLEQHWPQEDTAVVAEEEGGASAEDLVYRQSLLKQTIRQGDPEKEAVSFLILVDENTNTAFLPQMLQILADNQVAATFFVSGKFAEENPDLLKGILARGNELGNYSYDTTSPANLSLTENSQAIQKTYGIIKQYAGVKTKYFLPPYGILEADVLHAAQQSDHQLVLASVDSQDWLDIPPEQMLGNVLSQAAAGDLIALHPCVLTNTALHTLIQELKAKGLAIVPLSQQFT